MLLFSFAIIAGLVLLIWSADKFVSGAVSTALNLGMTPIMVGLTVVALGTSAPELIVSATAALEGSSELAVGNAIGSNIANIALVLSITILISAIPIKDSVLRTEFPILLLATLAATYFVWDAELVAFDGIALLAILIVSLVSLALMQNKVADDFDEVKENAGLTPRKAYSILFISILFLLASSHILVWGATGIARELGVSELVIGLTIVALGTSLPELAASVASAIKGHHDLALGNIIGSNLFNLLAVLAIPALIHPPELDIKALHQDYGVMLALTFGLALAAYGSRLLNRHYLGKIVGVLLFASYLGYLTLLFQQSVSV